MPEEAVNLAEAASRFIDEHPETSHSFGEIALLLGAGVSAGSAVIGGPAVALPGGIATIAAVLWERIERPRNTALPDAELALWADAGASFARGATEQDALNAATAYADLVLRSLEGDGAVASRLNVDRSRISQRLRDRSLYSFRQNETRYFPVWQFVPDGTLPGLRDVLAALDRDLHPLVVDHWFVSPSVDLVIGDVPVAPVVWLQTGGRPQVVAELAADL